MIGKRRRKEEASRVPPKATQTARLPVSLQPRCILKPSDPKSQAPEPEKDLLGLGLLLDVGDEPASVVHVRPGV